jgi:hypothetical protein
MPRNDKSMAAITSTIAAGTALAGMGVSVAQAIKANKQQKQAGQEAKAAANRIQNLTEANPFNQVQVPTLGFELAQQGIDRTSASTLNALQGAGAEGVIGGVGALMQGNREQELELAAQANEAAYNRDVAEANAQGGINTRAINRIEGLETSRLKGAQEAQAQAIENKNAAIKGIIGSATAGANVIAGAQTGAYKADKGLQKLLGLGYTEEEANQIITSGNFKKGRY